MPDGDLRASLREESRRLFAAVDEPSWERLAELGWTGLEVPAEAGGAGLAFGDLCVLLEERGRVLAGGPFPAAVVLGAGALAGSGDALLAGIAAGEAVVTAALDAEVDVSAGGGLRGVIGFVPDLDAAGAVAVRAADDALWLVARDALSDVRRQPTVDRTRSLWSARLDGAAGRILETTASALRDRAAVALAADCVGGAAACLDATVEYLRSRRQFGRPIGSFQALQHRCADMLLALERARAATAHAAEHAASPAAVSVAKSLAGDAYVLIAEEAISMHGGVGFTWEQGTHRFLKRARLNEAWMGDGRWHRRRLARLALEGEA